LAVLTQIFAHKIFALLLKEKCITPLVKEKMLSWRHSGFSLDASVKITSKSKEKTLRLLRYMSRNPVS
jgi:hypothetical protein